MIISQEGFIQNSFDTLPTTDLPPFLIGIVDSLLPHFNSAAFEDFGLCGSECRGSKGKTNPFPFATRIAELTLQLAEPRRDWVFVSFADLRDYDIAYQVYKSQKEKEVADYEAKCAEMLEPLHQVLKESAKILPSVGKAASALGEDLGEAPAGVAPNVESTTQTGTFKSALEAIANPAVSPSAIAAAREAGRKASLEDICESCEEQRAKFQAAVMSRARANACRDARLYLSKWTSLTLGDGL